MRRFHHSQFTDAAALTDQKCGNRVTVCIPTLNEAETIGQIIRIIKQELIDKVPLVDELLVIDSDSTDNTREIAAEAGATVHLSADIAREAGYHKGKGENLWKALHASTGDIICYLDGDISNFHSGFVTGLVGPLITDARVDYVKAYYERPFDSNDETISSGGGRVSEILVRPIISLFYPELDTVLQPLSGEYAARRGLLETLSFPTGYGVEIAHLIDLAKSGMLHQVGQCDLVSRSHRNRNDADLSDTAFAILQVVLRRLERDGIATFHLPIPTLHKRWKISSERVQRISKHIPETERPPLRP